MLIIRKRTKVVIQRFFFLIVISILLILLFYINSCDLKSLSTFFMPPFLKLWHFFHATMTFCIYMEHLLVWLLFFKLIHQFGCNRWASIWHKQNNSKICNIIQISLHGDIFHNPYSWYLFLNKSLINLMPFTNLFQNGFYTYSMCLREQRRSFSWFRNIKLSWSSMQTHMS